MTNNPQVTHSNSHQAILRVEIFYAPDPRLETEPTLELAVTASTVVFQIPPAAGDRFSPGALGDALLQFGAPLVVDHLEHAPAIGFLQEPEPAAFVIVNCFSGNVPSDEMVEDLRAEGWHIHDFRDMNGHRR